MIINDYRDLIGALSGGRPVIVSFDNGPRPSKPYAVVYLSLARPAPAHRQFATDDQGERYVEAHRPGRLLVHCYGKINDAWALADDIGMRIMTDAAIEAASAKNIAWMSQPTLESIPALMDNGDYEDRAILTIETAYTGAMIENVSFIGTVEIDVATDPPASGPEIVTITVP